MSLRHASFFSGVGGLDLGFERAGIKTVSLCEFDPYASAVLAERFPDVPNLGDITKIKKEDIHDADIWSGGFPCQDLSVAGARRGFTEGTRSSLAFTFLDLLAQRRPRWFVLENVPGLFSSNGGRDFSRLLREVVGLGYGVAWRTLDARHFGVAQRRRRVFIVAALDEAFGGLGADRAAEVLFECSGGCGHLEASRPAGEGSTAGSGGGVEVARALRASLGKRGERGDGGDELVIGTIGAGLAKRTGTTQDPHLVGWGDRTFGADISNSILSRYHKGINTTVEPGHLVGSEAHADGVREVDGLAGRVDDSAQVEDPRRLGNFELWDFPKEAVAPTISAKHDQRVMVYGGDVKAYSVREDAKANNFSATEIEVANALSAVWAGEQSHHAQTFIASAGFKAGNSALARGIGYEEEIAPTLEGGGGGNNKPTIIRTESAPVEEGLLSFPSRFGSNADVSEDITQSFAHSAGAPAVMRVGISYDGLNQKLEEDGAHRTIRVGRDSSDFVVAEGQVGDDPLLPIGLDSHRYRVAGNGVVAPVAEFIGRRIVAVDEKWFKKEVEG